MLSHSWPVRHERTRGTASISQIFKAAVDAFPNMDQESALLAYYAKNAEAERIQAAEVGEQTSTEELQSLRDIARMQFSDVVLTTEEAEFVSSHTDDKINRLLQKAGLTPEQANKAIKTR